MSETVDRQRQLHCTQIKHGWLAHTRINNYVCVCIGYIYLAPPLLLLLPLRLCACVRAASTPRWLQIFGHMRNQMLPTTTSTSQPFGSSCCCLTVLCSSFCYFCYFFCFLFGKLQKVYLSAVKTWLQTWNANANLVQSLHYADKPAENLQLRINPAQQILEKDRERGYLLKSCRRNNFIWDAWHVCIMLSKIVK